MSDALWIKKGASLVPADEGTWEILAAIRQGDYVRTSLPGQPRNPQFHKLMMAILQKVVEHTWPRFSDVGMLMDWLKIRSGMVREVYVCDGVVKLAFKSVSFLRMDEAEFKALSDTWLKIICRDVMPGVNPEDLLRKSRRAA